MNNSKELITQYIISHSRNKIVLFRDKVAGIEPVNMGVVLSESIFNLKELEKLSMRVSVKLEKILQEAITQHEEYGKILSISNIGILLEPELKLDMNRILDKYSQNNVLFVQWMGEIENGTLYFLSKEKGIKIDISNLSHIVV